jgi:hypothetical protein
MNRQRWCVVLVVVLGCAAKAPPPAAAPPEAPEPPPPGSQRLPDSIACASQPGCGSDCVSGTGNPARRVGALSTEAVREVVRERNDEIRECYDLIAQTHPEKEGRVVVRFAIAPSGAVGSSCLVTSSVNEGSVDRCVVERPLGWRFPEPSGGGWVVIDYPFALTRARGAE